MLLHVQVLSVVSHSAVKKCLLQCFKYCMGRALGELKQVCESISLKLAGEPLDCYAKVSGRSDRTGQYKECSPTWSRKCRPASG